MPHGHWRTTTSVAGLRQSGVVAPLVLDGPMTGAAICAWVEQFLAPARAPDAALLYLPPYSPDLNPIEQLFAKLKALLRKAAARTKDELWSTIGSLLDACPPADCISYLRHCGHGST